MGYRYKALEGGKPKGVPWSFFTLILIHIYPSLHPFFLFFKYFVMFIFFAIRYIGRRGRHALLSVTYATDGWCHIPDNLISIGSATFCPMNVYSLPHPWDHNAKHNLRQSLSFLLIQFEQMQCDAGETPVVNRSRETWWRLNVRSISF